MHIVNYTDKMVWNQGGKRKIRLFGDRIPFLTIGNFAQNALGRHRVFVIILADFSPEQVLYLKEIVEKPVVNAVSQIIARIAQVFVLCNSHI